MPLTVLFDLSRTDAKPNGSLSDAIGLALSFAQSALVQRVLVNGSSELERCAFEHHPGSGNLIWSNRHDCAVDLVVIPAQASLWQVSFLRWVYGAPVVSRWLDFIALERPEYSRNLFRWKVSVFASDGALERLDGIIWLSTFVADRRRQLFGSGSQAEVVLGVKITEFDADGPRCRPPLVGAESFARIPYILCVASSFPHKNREDAIQILSGLRAFGFFYNLIFVGPKAPIRCTAASEQRLAADLDLSDSVLDLGVVSSSELAWLYENAELSLSLSVDEGFGMVPFESARFGCPPLIRYSGAVLDLLPRSICIPEYSIRAAVDHAVRLLSDPLYSQRVISLVNCALPETGPSSLPENVSRFIEKVVRRPRPRFRAPTSARFVIPELVFRVLYSVKVCLRIVRASSKRGPGIPLFDIQRNLKF